VSSPVTTVASPVLGRPVESSVVGQAETTSVTVTVSLGYNDVSEVLAVWGSDSLDFRLVVADLGWSGGVTVNWSGVPVEPTISLDLVTADSVSLSADVTTRLDVVTNSLNFLSQSGGLWNDKLTFSWGS